MDLFDNPNLPQLAHWFIELLEPDETHFIPFSNCGGRSDEAAAILCRLAGEYQDGEVQWFVERMVGRRPSGDVLSFLWYDSTLEAKPPTEAPRAKVFASIDWAMLRSGWGDPKATVFALKGGQKDWDHQHHDTNHFVLYAQGRPLIVDLLYPHEIWGCETEAHNTIMVNGREQRGRVNVAGGHGNPRHRGVVADLIDAPWYTRLVGDASLAYEQEDVNSFVREVMYVRRAEEGDPGEYFVVFDDVEATGPSEMDWLLHTYGQVTVEGKRITFVQDEAAVDIALVSPAAFESEVKEKALEEVGSDKPFEGADAVRWVRVRPAERVQRGCFLSVLRPRPASASPEGARVIALEEPNVVGARVEQEGGSDVVMFALDQPEMKGAGVEAAGRSCFVRRAGGRVRAAALHGGHRITADGALLFEADGSGQAVLRFGGQTVEGRFDLYDNHTVRIHSPRRPTKALVNGEESAFEYQPEDQCVKLEGYGMREVRLLLEGE